MRERERGRTIERERESERESERARERVSERVRGGTERDWLKNMMEQSSNDPCNSISI